MFTRALSKIKLANLTKWCAILRKKLTFTTNKITIFFKDKLEKCRRDKTLEFWCIDFCNASLNFSNWKKKILLIERLHTVKDYNNWDPELEFSTQWDCRTLQIKHLLKKTYWAIKITIYRKRGNTKKTRLHNFNNFLPLQVKIFFYIFNIKNYKNYEKQW